MGVKFLLHSFRWQRRFSTFGVTAFATIPRFVFTLYRHRLRDCPACGV